MKDGPIPQLAAHIRRYYYESRREWLIKYGSDGDRLPADGHPKWDGGEDLYGRRHRPIWPKIAAFALEHDLDPQKLVQSVFHRAVGDAPLPNMLMSDSALKAALSYKAAELQSVKADVAASFRAAKQYIILRRREAPDDRTVWRRAILQPDQTNPLARYALAHSAGQFDLAARFYDEAVLEYLRHQEPYEDVLGKHLPPDFREGALRLKALWLWQDEP